MKLKRIAAALVIAAMALSMLSACGTKENAGPKAEETAKGEGKAAQDYSKKLSYTMSILEADKDSADERNKVLFQKFNVEFEFLPAGLANNEVSTKSRLWVAAGDMPDIMFLGYGTGASSGTKTGSVEVAQWARSGFLKEMPDLKKYPNLTRIRDSIKVNKNVLVDGKPYVWLSQNDSEKFNYTIPHTFIYRKDWAEKLGLAKPDDTYTWEEMESFIKQCIAKDPGGNGAGKTIGMVSIDWGFPYAFGLTQNLGLYNAITHRYELKDGKYADTRILPEFLVGLKAANKMYQEKTIWTEMALAKGQDGVNKYVAGLSPVMFHNMHYANAESAVNNMKKAFPQNDVRKMLAPMNVKNAAGKTWSVKGPGFYGGLVFNKKLSDEKMSRFLDMMEWTATEEGLMLNRYGIEGKDWVKKDGKLEILWPKDANGVQKNPYTQTEGRLRRLASYDADFTYVNPTLDKDAIAVHTAVLEMKSKAEYPVEVQNEINVVSAPNKDKGIAGWDDKLKELIMNSKDIEKDWKAYVETIRPQIKAIEDEINAALGKK